ncbi:hypothetical protein ZYGR_0N01780 [Zygosaccharomyces rouxii]|uniref:SWIRM domain-containing protein n=1 Tax=Zygosaccharomyces rouxii TaxID=4956 RepID=A0A1Q2ZZP2_ZYGRO|nr:hypothetical protein ZYGR_0N01780 [Zygosaccharomyces rouxii]
MEFYSPQPEHAQLGSMLGKANERLLSQLHQQVLAATNGNLNNNIGGVNPSTSIDSVLSSGNGSNGEHPIPSPPLSPKFDSHHYKISALPDDLREEEDEDEDDSDSIKVQLSWVPGLSPKRYRYAHSNFLGEYRIFSPHATQPRTRRYNTKKSLDHQERSAQNFNRTRRFMRRHEMLLSDTQDDDDDYSDELQVPKRPSTPQRRRRTAQPLGSPLASATAVSGIPQYVPNMSWEKLPDYSPDPYKTLPENNSKSLKVEWKGSPMDLSHDPLRHQLHPAELVLSQILRLPCDLYLDSKRRLFLEKVHRLKQGLPFRRTDAQKACRIDVNKASRLYAAFEKVGWLNDSDFRKFL